MSKVDIDLDYEWVSLMMEAKSLGMTVEEIRLFLAEAKLKNNP